jgi:hypothetical protein
MKQGSVSALNKVLTYLVLIFALHAVFVWFRHYLLS